MQTRAVFGKRPPVSVAPPLAPRAWKTSTIDFREPVTEASIARLASDTAAAAAGGADEIVWVLSSPGGELLPALEYCHTLAASPLKLKTFGVGCVASAATYLMLAGAQRIAHPDATFLFHEVSTRLKPPPGTFVARSVERHRQLFELTAHEVYRKSTRLPHDMIARFAHETIILNAAQALEYGVVHRIAENFADACADAPTASAA